MAPGCLDQILRGLAENTPQTYTLSKSPVLIGLMDMLGKNSTWGTSKTQKFLHFDVMNDEINDCFGKLVIIVHVSLDIHWLVRRRTDS